MYGWLCKSREKVEYGKSGSAAEGIEDLIDAENRDLWNFCDLIRFLIVDRDSDAT